MQQKAIDRTELFVEFSALTFISHTGFALVSIGAGRGFLRNLHYIKSSIGRRLKSEIKIERKILW